MKNKIRITPDDCGRIISALVIILSLVFTWWIGATFSVVLAVLWYLSRKGKIYDFYIHDTINSTVRFLPTYLIWFIVGFGLTYSICAIIYLIFI